MSEETKQTMRGSREGADLTPEESGGAAERLFTQDEVNRIVSERLSREREKRAAEPEGEREAALKAREARLACREYLDEKRCPAVLLEVLDTSDPARFREAVATRCKGLPGLLGAVEIRGAQTPRPPVRSPEGPEAEIARAFRPKI